MYKEKFIKEFREMIKELDQDINQYALAIGFFMGKGCDFKQADELAHEEILSKGGRRDGGG
jgi:hypothetical protein